MLTITTLKNRSNFLRLRRGRKFVTPFFILRSMPSDVSLTDTARVGYTVTTQCGNAVIRNRMKRRLRALVRELFPLHASANTDYIFIALAGVTPNVAEAPIDDLRAAVERALAAGAKG